MALLNGTPGGKPASTNDDLVGTDDADNETMNGEGAQDDTEADSDDSEGSVLCTIMQNEDGGFTLVSGDEPDELDDMVAPEGASPAEGGTPALPLSFVEQLFCYKYVELRRNGRAAAIAAGYSQAAASSRASELIKRPEIRKRIVEIAQPALRVAALDMQEMLAQIHAVATFDRRKLYHPDGSRKLFTELDAKTAAAISHMGASDFVPFDKMKAVDMAMKHLGGFEKDNEQRRENLQIAVTFT
jgi:phage terminase small subunit